MGQFVPARPRGTEHTMLDIDARKMMSTAVPAPASALAGVRPLSPEAQRVAAEPTPAAYSPIVLAGLVRMIDAVAIAVIGIIIYFAHVFPTYGFAWYYLGANAAIAALAVLAFQAADIYDVQ